MTGTYGTFVTDKMTKQFQKKKKKEVGKGMCESVNATQLFMCHLPSTRGKYWS